jgi:hypothetical protein
MMQANKNKYFNRMGAWDSPVWLSGIGLLPESSIQ